MSIRPTTARIAPRVIQGRWSIMKLDAGQCTRPEPWAIHSNPISAAATPVISRAAFIRAAAMNELPNVCNGWKADISSAEDR